jgi:hypothetical protein
VKRTELKRADKKQTGKRAKLEAERKQVNLRVFTYQTDKSDCSTFEPGEELVCIDCDTYLGCELPLRPIVRVGGRPNAYGWRVAVEITLHDQDTGISNYHAVTGSTVGPRCWPNWRISTW